MFKAILVLLINIFCLFAEDFDGCKNFAVNKQSEFIKTKLNLELYIFHKCFQSTAKQFYYLFFKVFDDLLVYNYILGLNPIKMSLLLFSVKPISNLGSKLGSVKISKFLKSATRVDFTSKSANFWPIQFLLPAEKGKQLNGEIVSLNRSGINCSGFGKFLES